MSVNPPPGARLNSDGTLTDSARPPLIATHLHLVQASAEAGALTIAHLMRLDGERALKIVGMVSLAADVADPTAVFRAVCEELDAQHAARRN